MTKLAMLYEHRTWFAPLFAVLDRRGIYYQTVSPGTPYDPADTAVPAPVLNDTRALTVDPFKARQLALISRLALAIPASRVVNRAADVAVAAEAIGFPLVVKANTGGADAGIVRFDTRDEFRAAVDDGDRSKSIGGVSLVQELVPDEGIEPPTFGLQNRCTTAVLIRPAYAWERVISPAGRVIQQPLSQAGSEDHQTMRAMVSPAATRGSVVIMFMRPAAGAVTVSTRPPKASRTSAIG